MQLDETRFKKILIDEGILNEEEIKGYEKDAEAEKLTLADYLAKTEAVPQKYFTYALGKYFDIESVKLTEIVLPEKLLSGIEENFARTRRLIPFAENDKEISVAMEDPSDNESIKILERQLGKPVKIYLATTSDISRALLQFKRLIKFEPITKGKGPVNIRDLAEDIQVIEFLDSVIDFAVSAQASDIHIENHEDFTLVRARIAGACRDITTAPPELHAPLVARIRILSQLKIDEHFKPQDGRFKKKIGGRDVSFRVSILPNYFGEKIVLRILDTGERFKRFGDLGLTEEETSLIEKSLQSPYGMYLITGPTGSGKSTTLYTMLRWLNTPEMNLCTIEDPVEFTLKRVNQTQVNPTVGLTFAAGLRALLRQAPDIIMVGEIRDTETAEVSIHAALTGHKLLSTLHTNNAIGAITRLTDMGVQPFLVASTISLVIAQRLVRKICPDCITSLDLPVKTVEQIKADLRVMGYGDIDFPKTVYKGVGCNECGMTGYLGQSALFEILPISEKLKALISQGANDVELTKLAAKEGLIPLLTGGLRKIKAGETTIEELLRVVKG